MIKVYVVMQKIQYEGSTIVAIFNSKESAEEEAKAQDEALGDWGEDVSFEVAEYELMS